MLVACPETVHRNVADWPRWIEPGSAGSSAFGFAGGGGGGGCGSTFGGGGGGGGGAFFLQPAANTHNSAAIPMTLNCRLLNMNVPLLKSNYLLQTGVQLLP